MCQRNPLNVLLGHPTSSVARLSHVGTAMWAGELGLRNNSGMEGCTAVETNRRFRVASLRTLPLFHSSGAWSTEIEQK